MSTFILIPGAGGPAWFWHRVDPELRARGHDAIAVELPADDERAGLEVEEIEGSHSVALSRPGDLADRLVECLEASIPTRTTERI